MLSQNIRVVIAVEAVKRLIPVYNIVVRPYRVIHIIFRFRIFSQHLGQINGPSVNMAVSPGPIEQTDKTFFGSTGLLGIRQLPA